MDGVENENNDAYSVTDLNTLIKNVLTDIFEQQMTVEGEISNIKFANNNLFLTLKDMSSSIQVIFWSFDKYKKYTKTHDTSFTNGDMVKVTGSLTCFIKSGSYNINAKKIIKSGLGDLHTEYEKLRDTYNKLGYFDVDKKKILPKNITKLGIITAPEGAALQDILYVLNKNKYKGKIVVKRANVQGNLCPSTVAQSIEYLNNWKDTDNKQVDAILVSRGGGSFEDLMGYSHPLILEALHKSNIFTISAVGHEVDTMLSDHVADLRAPTPSIAAEIITKQQKIITDVVESGMTVAKMTEITLDNKLMFLQHKLDTIATKLISPISKIEMEQSKLLNMAKNAKEFIDFKMHKLSSHLSKIYGIAEKHNTNAYLEDGYTIITDMNSGKLCTSVTNIIIGQKLNLIFKDGDAEIIVNRINSNNEQRDTNTKTGAKPKQSKQSKQSRSRKVIVKS